MLFTQIDPIELALAVLGVKPIVSKKFEKVLKSDVEEMQRLPAKIERLARDLAAGELEGAPYTSDLKYHAMLKDLSQPYKPDQIQALARSFAKYPAQLTEGFMAKAAQVFEAVKAAIPKSVSVTFAGATNLEPDPISLHAFASVLSVLDDPLTMFPLIANASATQKQIAAVRGVYPTLSAAIDEALVMASASERASRKDYELPTFAEIGVSKWMGQPGSSAAFQKATAAAQKAQASSDGGAAPSRPKSGTGKDAMTQAQRSLYPGAID